MMTARSLLYATKYYFPPEYPTCAKSNTLPAQSKIQREKAYRWYAWHTIYTPPELFASEIVEYFVVLVTDLFHHIFGDSLHFPTVLLVAILGFIIAFHHAILYFVGCTVDVFNEASTLFTISEISSGSPNSKAH